MDMMKEHMRMMKEQMEENAKLRAENDVLRSAKPQQPTSTKKPSRPLVELCMSENDWELFLHSWNRYKHLAGLVESDQIRWELRECCAGDVDKQLFHNVGPAALYAASEEVILENIKKVAVKIVHKEVHRFNFAKLRQQDGETITQFVSRLKEAAAQCGFSVRCTKTLCGSADDPTLVSYAEDSISQQLLVGLRNQTFQTRLLSEVNTLDTLAKKVERLVILESTEECANVLNSSTPETKAAAARHSTYKDRQRDERFARETDAQPCPGCGWKSHGRDKSMKMKDCPAQKKKCNNCAVIGHFQAVCPLKKSAKHSNANRAADWSNQDGQGEEEPMAALASATTQFF